MGAMKILIASLVLLALVACGSNGSSSPPFTPDASALPDVAPAIPDAAPDTFVDPLLGTWIDQVDSSGNTTIRFKFDGTNFEMDILELLTDGTYGMRIDQGTYTLTPATSTINVRLMSSSCQGVISFSGNAGAWTYSKTGNSLSVNTGTSYLACQLETSAPTGMGAAVIGCFKSDGTFIAHSASPVP